MFIAFVFLSKASLSLCYCYALLHFYDYYHWCYLVFWWVFWMFITFNFCGCKLVFQWDRLVLKQGMLHRLHIKYHQLGIPQKYHHKVLATLHNNMGHQGIDYTLDLLCERLYWPSMAWYAQAWVTGCRHCQLAHSNYTEPKPKIEHHRLAIQLGLICLNFTKVDPSKFGKKNVLVIIDVFIKFSVVACMCKSNSKKRSPRC